MDSEKIWGRGWRLINPVDFIIIGLMAILFLLCSQVMGLGWAYYLMHRVPNGNDVPPSQAVSNGQVGVVQAAPLVSTIES